VILEVSRGRVGRYFVRYFWERSEEEFDGQLQGSLAAGLIERNKADQATMDVNAD
jgi:hypothetical protein